MRAAGRILSRSGFVAATTRTSMTSEPTVGAGPGAGGALSRVSPYLLLSFTMLFWAGNITLGRALHTEVPPFGISFWRWGTAALLLLPFSLPYLRGHWRYVGRRWKSLAFLAFLLIGSGNTVLYVAVNHTTAINAGIVNAAQPLFTAALAWLVLRETLSRAQAFGIALSLAGVLAIVTRGELAVLLGLGFNPGDLLMVVAVVSWALYAVLLKRWRHELHPIAFLQMILSFGALAVLPFYLWETAFDRPMHANPTTIAFVLYAAVLASIVAVVFWNIGVAAVGPNRSSVLVNLIPAFTTLFAVGFLDETVRLYHVVGFALILTGILLMIRRRADEPAEA
jgi:drug/metabolite transporter (DMT)-like permease